ncbi:MAG: SIS domain-containing protein [Pseudomonadota bacterium]
MRREIEEIPAAVERLLAQGGGTIDAITHAYDTRFGPAGASYLASVARGSSDHASTFLKYASELRLGRPMASIGPSVVSMYGADLKADGALCLAVSQSGQSPDIVRLAKHLREAGALTVAITNTPESPLGNAADAALPIHAGPERSVAATKTFVTSLVAGLWLLAKLSNDRDVLAALTTLPDALERALGCDWSAAGQALTGNALFTLGRGPSLAIAQEAALKFKETAQIHAECFSAAEVLHGPVAIVDEGFAVLVFAARDAAEDATVEVADTLAGLGAHVFVTSAKARDAHVLPAAPTGHWITDPISVIVSFYAMVETLARQRGIDPDTPRNLKKVTQTL